MLSPIVELPVSHVFRRADARKIDRAAVKALMSSIREVGIINPLRVRPARKNVNGTPTDAYEVTAGAHRLDAALHLGLPVVPCIVVEEADLRAELAMIDENLCRAELSDAERAANTARRKALYLELHPETTHGGDRASRQLGDLPEGAARFTEATAEITGRSERAVQRDAERGEKIADDVLAKVQGTKLDSGVYLDKIKKLDPEEQRHKVKRDLANPPKPVKKPPAPLNDIETQDKWLASIMALWNRASQEWREAFLALIDTPIMDLGEAEETRTRLAAAASPGNAPRQSPATNSDDDDGMRIPAFMRRTG